MDNLSNFIGGGGGGGGGVVVMVVVVVVVVVCESDKDEIREKKRDRVI